MPQLLILAAIGAGVYFGGRWVRKTVSKINRDLEKAANIRRQEKSKTPPPEKDFAELKKDPKTGVYRVDDE